MKRVIRPHRKDWQKTHQEIGFYYFNLPSKNGSTYRSEGVTYEFTLKQIEQLEGASNELDQMCLEVVADMIRRGHYPAYFQPPNKPYLLLNIHGIRKHLHFMVALTFHTMVNTSKY